MVRIAEAQETQEVAWGHKIPDDQWAYYEGVLREVQARGIPFAIGGGFAFSHYSSRWRNTKDLDIYVEPHDRHALIDIVTKAGFGDYYEKLSYDRSWIYRSYKDDVIIDIIWEMANHRTRADMDWLTRGDEVQIRGLKFRMLPAEELIWAKLYIVQRERCDWPDLLNVINNRGATLDWDHLLSKVHPDERLVASLLNVFAWLCPGKAAALPRDLWQKLSLPEPTSGPECNPQHIRLFDSRDWFGAVD